MLIASLSRAAPSEASSRSICETVKDEEFSAWVRSFLRPGGRRSEEDPVEGAA
jgi:hypothetical protein